MASAVWRKIQHQNKRATKFRVVARFIELVIECSPKWQPAAVCVAWIHRKRRYVSKVSRPLVYVCNWEPSITNPYCGIILWPSQCTESLEIVTTLYRDQHSEEFDDKEWTFVVEEVANSGRRFRPIASAKLNMRMFANEAPGTMSMLKLQMRPLRESLQKCTLELLLGCTVLKEGAATDDDMRSLASFLSSQPSKDVGDLHDFDDEFGSRGSMTLPTSCPVETSRPSTNGFIDDEQWKLQVTEVVSDIGALEKIPSAELAASTTALSNDSFKSICDGELHATRVETPKFDSKSVLEEHNHRRGPNGSTQRPVMTSTPTETRSSSSGFFDSLLSNSMAKRDSVVNDSQASVTSQDLLSWCQESCRGYRGVRISNFSSSWRNGIAFAALIHRYRPDLIDFDSLSPTEIRENCRKAFDAAALLNVPRLIDPNDMVIMTIPDKIAVMTYVYNLKAALTGASPVNDADVSDALTIGSKLTQSSGRPSSIASSEVSNEPRLAVSPSKLSSPSEPPKSMRSCSPSGDEPARLSYTLSANSIQKPVLMTRKELMNPFDSDDESQTAATMIASTEADNVPTMTSSVTAEHADIDSPAAAVVGKSRQEELRRRVREMVEKFPANDEQQAKLSAESERFQELTSRARQIIKQLGPGGNEPIVIRLSETLQKEVDSPTATNGQSQVPFSAPVTRQTTPEASSIAVSRSSANSIHHGYPGSAGVRLPSPITKESLLISTGATPVANKALQSVQNASESAFARFKRFGSMRGQELAQSINMLSSRLGETVRSAGGGKETFNEHPSDEEEQEKPPTKIITPLDLELQLQSVTEEMDALVAKQKELDHKAIEVEKQWRKVMQEGMPGSEQEQQLMNDYLSLLNERNMLTRREMHLSLLETIRSYENRFAAVQKELAELMETEESEKTEALKQRIDFLMEELISIVNKRDELVQQLMAHDQGTEEDAEMAHNVLKNSILMDSEDHKNCVIQ
ncbi:NT-C2 and CH and DUF3585 domain containing protei n [Trichuris trichiura]|uniref:NT-C2 and CH and DUF3585 domain containing protei n n=1 Tax=Trichuris trichiura TaxID=36087 RepID=A0A077YYD2_TRITR|nr:NT-C2 and CH and DUF3585 domain containing protei n [Trichuris trichiura]